MTISKIGFGSWGIGGLMNNDASVDNASQIEAMSYGITKGINYIGTSVWYAENQAAKNIKEAIDHSGVNRSEVFLSQTVYPYTYKTVDGLENEIETYLTILNSDYIDNITVSTNTILSWGRELLFSKLQELLTKKVIRHVSITNADTLTTYDFYQQFKDNVFGNELTQSFELRFNQDNGVTGMNSLLGLKTLVYQSLRRGRTAARNWPLLVELAKKYEVTQNQIILAWLCSKGFIPFLKMQKKEHVDENLAATTLAIEADDISRIEQWRIPNFTTPLIDWYFEGSGILASSMPNRIDELIDQTS